MSANGRYSADLGPGVLLFDEDFDLPPPENRVPEPEFIEPMFSLAELRAAEEDAARDSRQTALAETAASADQGASHALTVIAEQLVAARAEVASIAEQSTEAIARLLIDCFAAAFPALSARYGPAETTAILRHLLPTLHREPKVTIRVSPLILDAVKDEISVLDPDLADHIRLIPTDAMAPGDARVTWENGSATRDTTSLWSQIEAVLAPAGLLNTARTVKEHALVE